MRIKSIFAAPFLMIVVLALLTVSSLIDPMALGTDMNLYLAVIILELLVYALPAVFFCRLRGKEYGRKLRVRLFRFSHIFLILLGLVLLLTGSTLLNMLMHSLFRGETADSSYAGVMNAGTYAVLAFSILPAVAEEFLFRSILIAEYETVSPSFAVLISALFFGMIHMDFMRLPAYVFAGIVLALVFYTTRSVFASVLLHVLNNIAALWTDVWAQKFSAAAGKQSVPLSFILISLFLTALILFFWEAQRIYQEYGERGVPSPHVRRKKRGEPSGVLEALTTPPFVIFIVMYIVFTLLRG